MGTYQGGTAIPIVFRTGNRAERLRIRQDGKLQIGTSAGNATYLALAGNAAMDLWGDGSEYPTLRLGTESYNTVGEDIRFGRKDHGTADIRYHSLKSRHGDSAANNYLEFFLHDFGSSPYTSQRSSLKIQGDGRVGVKNNLNYAFNTSSNTLCIGDGGGAVGLTIWTAVGADSQNISFHANESLSRAEGEISYGPSNCSTTANRNAMMFRVNSGERLRIDSAGRLTLNQCDRTANAKALRIKADNDTTSNASTDRTGSNSYKNSAIVIQKGISNGGLVAGLIDAWDGSIHGTSIGITYTSGRYHTSFGVNNDTNDRPVEIMTISGNKKVKIGGGIASIGADVGLEIGGDGATTEIRLKNSGGGTGASDGFAIQKWSNGNNYIYDYDSNNILFGTGNLSRTSMDTSGRWCFSPGPSLQTASSAFTMSLIHEGNFSSTGIYPGIAMKSTDTGGGDGMVIHAFDNNWDLYTNSGNRDGISIANDAMNAGSGNSRVCIGGDGVITMGKTVNSYLNTSRYCGTALHVAGGALSIGGNGSGTASYRAGVYTLGWYITQHANANFYHLKTDLWAGGSPHGNNEYIMGGFRIEGYSYSSPTGSSTAWIQFHNWNGAYPGLSVKQHYHNWDMNPAVYTSSDGYVVLRVNGGTYKGHVIDLIQHTNYGSRDINVSSTAYNNNSTHF